MSVRKRLLSSESVPNGHPDKLADRIADAALENEVDLSTPISVQAHLRELAAVSHALAQDIFHSKKGAL